MDQNQMLLYIMVGGCGLCVLYGILKRPSYLLVLLARGGFCSALIFFIHIYCQKNGRNVCWRRASVKKKVTLFESYLPGLEEISVRLLECLTLIM